MLKDQDRIFTNLYGMHERTLAVALSIALRHLLGKNHRLSHAPAVLRSSARGRAARSPKRRSPLRIANAPLAAKAANETTPSVRVKSRRVL